MLLVVWYHRRCTIQMPVHDPKMKRSGSFLLGKAFARGDSYSSCYRRSLYYTIYACEDRIYHPSFAASERQPLLLKYYWPEREYQDVRR